MNNNDDEDDHHSDDGGDEMFRQEAANCDEDRPFICEFSLEPSAETTTTHGADASMVAPSYVGSCDEIAVLSLLASELLKKAPAVNRPLDDAGPRNKQLLDVYAEIKQGFYIFLPASAILSPPPAVSAADPPQEGSSFLENLYRVEYCDFERANGILYETDRDDLITIFLRMYK